MRWNKAFSIYRKEIRELLRDKKTIFLMVALPLIIYPLIIMGISSVMIMVESGYESSEYTLRVDESVKDQALLDYLTEKIEDSDVTFSLVDRNTENEALSYSEELDQGLIDVYLAYENGTYSMYYNSSSVNSDHASEYLNDRLNTYKDELVVNIIEEAGFDSDAFLNPIEIQVEDLASNEQSMGHVLGMIVPLLLIMGVFLGTMTPAVDVTAGEKERGTQETLMSFPISGQELICGKYLAVSTVGAVSAFLYLISVGMLAAYMLILMGGVGEMSFEVGAFVPALLVVIISTLAFSLFLGAAIMCMCSFAKSTKEASSYISPIMVVIMMIAYMGYLDVHLTVGLSVVPVLNIVLLIKSVLAFEYNTMAIIIVLVSNIAYAAIAISVLGKLYTSERILFGEHSGSLFERRTNRDKGSVPTFGDAVLVLAVTAVLYLYVGSLLQVKLMLIGVGLTQLIILGMPIFATWYGNVDYAETFSLKKVNIKQIVSVVILAIGAFIFCNIACQPLASIAKDSTQVYADTFSSLMGDVSFPLAWLVVGIAPAICEEAMFRGYLFSSLKKKLKPWMYIAISALVFGIYHLNLYQGTYAFLLGLILAYVVYVTGSIFGAALIHFICNSMAVLVSFFPEQIGKLLPFVVSDTYSVGGVVAFGVFGALVTAAGLFLVTKSSKRKMTN